MTESVTTAPKRTNRRRVAAVVAALVVLGGGALAMTYGGGDGPGGDGSGTLATSDDGALTVVQSDLATPLGPGAAPQALSGTFDNPSSEPAWVSTVSVDIVDVVEAEGVEGRCAPSDYLLEDRVMQVDELIPPGAEQGAWSGGTVQFNNTSANQDACKGATVVLDYEIGTP